MAYATYTTEAIVCGSYDRNGSDKQFRLFTKDSGMLFATARSVREERSKQRQALQDFSHVHVSLVRAKSGWRIGSVEAIFNSFVNAPNRKSRAQVVGAIKLINQFLQGEEAHPDVYKESLEFLQFTQTNHEFDTQNALLLFELRLLKELGYVHVTKNLSPLFELSESYETLLANLSDNQLNEVGKVLVMGREVSHL